ncbi:hypothetical protein LCGC14_0915370 [marine sediment metagenome]|uniref:Uncharacterized protein n=1 Tax=marine sediment metagenome TaxID=412755 RepID=A0A0F9RZ45_9ZZZZ
MFQITHDNQFVYSLMRVTELTKSVIKEESIEDLMFLWANKTAIPYLKWMSQFRTDNIDWYLKDLS